MDTSTSFKNILKKDKIRVFTCANKYILVDPYDFAFMLFERLDGDNVNAIDYVFRSNISAFSGAKRVFYTAIPTEDIRYMCEIYKDSAYGEISAGGFKQRQLKLMNRHGIRRRFAKLLALIPNKFNRYEICHDLREASFYLKNNPSLMTILKKGSQNEQKSLLKRILPARTYNALRIDSFKYENLDIVAQEILHIKP